MTEIVVTLKRWDPGRLPEILAACGAERLPEFVSPALRWAVALAEDDAAERVLGALGAHPDVASAFRSRSFEQHAAFQAAWTDDAAIFATDWRPKRIGLYPAHRYGTGDAAVKIAVLDNGLGLASPMADMPYPPNDDTRRWNSYANSTDVTGESATNQHGENTSSIIFATPNNSIGFAGVAPGCTFLFSYPKNAGTFPDYLVFESIAWAADNGARVINMSFGSYWGGVPTAESEAALAAYQSAVDYAWNAGAVIVAAAGNRAQLCGPDIMIDGFWVPAMLDHVVAVGASDSADDIMAPLSAHLDIQGSSYGPLVEIVAPGEAVALASHLGYTTGDGTSFSSPCVAGVVGLIASQNVALTAAELVEILTASATRGRSSSFASYFPNAGVVSAYRAAAMAKSTTGVICPVLDFWGAGVSSGMTATTLSGAVTMEARGFATVPVTRVQVYLGASLLYDGPPAIIAGTATYSAGTAQQMKIVAYTAGGSAEETYTSGLLVSTFAVGTVTPVLSATLTAPASWTDPETPIPLEVAAASYHGKPSAYIVEDVAHGSAPPGSPALDDARWSASAPATHLLSGTGDRDVYLWVKNRTNDVAGTSRTVSSVAAYAVPSALPFDASGPITLAPGESRSWTVEGGATALLKGKANRGSVFDVLLDGEVVAAVEVP